MTRNTRIQGIILIATGVAMGLIAAYLAEIDSAIWLLLAGITGFLSWGLLRLVSPRIIVLSFVLGTILAAGALIGSAHWVHLATAVLLLIGNSLMAVHLFMRRHVH